MNGRATPMTGRARTIRAAVVAIVVTLGAVAGIAVFLGFPVTGSVIAGAVSGVLASALVLAASRRAASFHPAPDVPPATDPTVPADEQPPIAHSDTATDDTGTSR
ncbi:MAG: hypothetical protein WD007_04345 [Nitriliruptoraceae bacterium]